MKPDLEASILERLVRISGALYAVDRHHPQLVDVDSVIIDLGYQPNGRIKRDRQNASNR